MDTGGYHQLLTFGNQRGPKPERTEEQKGWRVEILSGMELGTSTMHDSLTLTLLLVTFSHGGRLAGLLPPRAIVLQIHKMSSCTKGNCCWLCWLGPFMLLGSWYLFFT
jgi:hypothetical protein